MPKAGQIRVTTTTRASPDGVTVHRYLAGETYGPDSDPPMPADLAETFFREGWGERCGGDGQVPPQAVAAPASEPAPAAPPAEPDAACDWCGAPFTAHSGRGGPAKRFCSDAHRAAFHRGGRRWIARELEAGRLDIADLREA